MAVGRGAGRFSRPVPDKPGRRRGPPSPGDQSGVSHRPGPSDGEAGSRRRWALGGGGRSWGLLGSGAARGPGWGSEPDLDALLSSMEDGRHVGDQF